MTENDTLRLMDQMLDAANRRALRHTECRFADGEHGPCGGPSNGRECWDHKGAGSNR